jgi:hypothetical protein
MLSLKLVNNLLLLNHKILKPLMGFVLQRPFLFIRKILDFFVKNFLRNL